VLPTMDTNAIVKIGNAIYVASRLIVAIVKDVISVGEFNERFRIKCW
jgi:hypothetical protein